MAAGDLITTGELLTACPDLTTEQQADAPSLISAASRHIAQAYPKARPSTTYDEPYEVDEDRRIRLRNPRVTAISRVALDNQVVLQITAQVGPRRAGTELVTAGEADALTCTGLKLTSTTAGVPAADITLLWSNYPTVGQLAAWINGLAGWSAVVAPGHEDLATVDITPTQGYRSAIGQPAHLWAFTRDLDDYHLEAARTLVLPHTIQVAYRHPDRTWGVDARTSTIRVVYTAGWRTVPADIKRACILCVSADLTTTNKAGNIVSEKSDDYSYQLAEDRYEFPPEARRLLRNYKDWRIS